MIRTSSPTTPADAGRYPTSRRRAGSGRPPCAEHRHGGGRRADRGAGGPPRVRRVRRPPGGGPSGRPVRRTRPAPGHLVRAQRARRSPRRSGRWSPNGWPPRPASASPAVTSLWTTCSSPASTPPAAARHTGGGRHATVNRAASVLLAIALLAGGGCGRPGVAAHPAPPDIAAPSTPALVDALSGTRWRDPHRPGRGRRGRPAGPGHPRRPAAPLDAGPPARRRARRLVPAPALCWNGGSPTPPRGAGRPPRPVRVRRRGGQWRPRVRRTGDPAARRRSSSPCTRSCATSPHPAPPGSSPAAASATAGVSNAGHRLLWTVVALLLVAGGAAALTASLGTLARR